ncbi:GNAT family N-acetyltransferase [Actinotalea sp. M2MS4P-6]|uniref:GNAT family N-acetyltransferase n=1 Tax=Actinotalea sp. M2MS4P-6 TaxID=2983762 RepID=UPI0021E3894C|nr:GNAT family N-acetyltransferase [Actinotalea sp. M2MS4P-6]MCV2394025.1 GNAT family N-acetyltransferase [Actinotalea sp. M2MS4P-6]
MIVRTAVPSDRSTLAVLAAGLQRRPERHVAYLGLDAETIAAEMVAEDDDWTAVSAVAERDGAPVGWLVGSVDQEIGRVWWFGPFITAEDEGWVAIADALDAHARALLPAAIDQEELAPDARFDVLIAWARAHGFAAESGSAVLTLGGPLPGPAVEARPLRPDDVDVAALHDRLFPRTHATGDGLLRDADPDHLRLVVEQDGTPVGYLAAERQPDGDGYLDFLGVAEHARRQGWGGELVKAAVAALRALGCGRVHLTVRETNVAARSLYQGLGFVEERVIAPQRRGFSLD